MKQTRQAVRAFKQSIYLDVYGVDQSTYLLYLWMGKKFYSTDPRVKLSSPDYVPKNYDELNSTLTF